MHLRDHPSTAAALLLACIAAHYALVGAPRGWPGEAPLAITTRPPLPAPGSSARAALDWCRGNVATIHDLYWASACTFVAKEQRRRRIACDVANVSRSGPAPDAECAAGFAEPDDSPDCTLPDDRAGPLNAARAKAEQQCLDDAMGGDLQAGR